MYKNIEFTTESLNDYLSLSEELQEICDEVLKKLSKNLNLGIQLENKDGKDLTDCYKLYFDEARYRVIYQKEFDKIKIECITKVKIIAIGERDKKRVYEMAALRLGCFKINK